MKAHFSTGKKPQVLMATRVGWWVGTTRLPSLLHQADASLTVFGPANCVVMRSRFIDRRIPVSSNPKLFTAALRKHLEAEGHQYDWVVLCDEPTLNAVWESRDGNWPGKYFPVEPTKAGFDRIMSKAAFAEFAPQFGVPVPKSKVCESLHQAVNEAKAIGYPVMLKTALGTGGDGVMKVDSEAQLREQFQKFGSRLPVVVQEFIDGALGATQLLLDHGTPISWMATEKWLPHPTPMSPSSARKLFFHPEMENIVKAVGQMTQFHGQAGIDWMMRKDGSIAVLEFNPRPTPAMNLNKLGGADAGVALHAMLRGQQNIQAPTLKPGEELIVYMFPQHLKRCFGRHDWLGLLRWIPFVSKHDIAWDEPWMLWDTVKDFANRAWRRLIGANKKKAAIVAGVVASARG